jgi:hypothetical protein
LEAEVVGLVRGWGCEAADGIDPDFLTALFEVLVEYLKEPDRFFGLGHGVAGGLEK